MADSSSSVARSSRDEKPVSYTLKLQSFSLLKKAVACSNTQRFESQIFVVGGYKWKLALYPNGDENRNGSGHISLYLVMVDDAILSTLLEVKAMFTFLVYDHIEDNYLTVEDGKMRRFSAMKVEWGIEKLLQMDSWLMIFVFGVDICVMKFDDGNGEVFSLIKQPKNYIYTWKVHNFSQRNESYYESESFDVESCTWNIRLYPKGDSTAKPDFLSLFLHLQNFEKFSEGFEVYVEYEMAILSVDLEVHKQESGSRWFGNGPTGWGYSNFMSLTEVKDTTKRFIGKDTIIIEVKINVISTMKKI